LVTRFVRELAKQHGRSFRGITSEAMEILVNAHWPGNVRELRNLVESMVVLAPGRRIEATDIPTDVREGGTRFLPARVSGAQPSEGSPQELAFIFQSLVELKLQIEELQRRMDTRPEDRVEVVEVGVRPDRGDGREVIHLTSQSIMEEEEEPEQVVIYRAGMRMQDVERAAIEAALTETNGNRRRAAEHLGIGERTLYRKIKEFGLA
jgi:DNA-binding NtrC family response regulator